jgi:hypothetical protein
VVTLGFSKYGHLPVEQVLIGMLRWCVKGDIDHVENRPWLKHAIIEEIARHATGTPTNVNGNTNGHAVAPAADTKDLFKGVVNRAYRRTAPLFHPDHKGGSDTQMIAINSLKNEILKEIDAIP